MGQAFGRWRLSLNSDKENIFDLSLNFLVSAKAFIVRCFRASVKTGMMPFSVMDDAGY
jgi:hypothetical protein